MYNISVDICIDLMDPCYLQLKRQIIPFYLQQCHIPAALPGNQKSIFLQRRGDCTLKQILLIEFLEHIPGHLGLPYHHLDLLTKFSIL